MQETVSPVLVSGNECHSSSKCQHVLKQHCTRGWVCAMGEWSGEEGWTFNGDAGVDKIKGECIPGRGWPGNPEKGEKSLEALSGVGVGVGW